MRAEYGTYCRLSISLVESIYIMFHDVVHIVAFYIMYETIGFDVLGVQKSSELFFVKFNLYLKTNEKILISEIFSVCINDLLPSFGELANSLTIETHRLRSDKVINAFSYLF